MASQRLTITAPQSLIEQVKRKAALENRSLAAQIRHLMQTYADGETTPAPSKVAPATTTRAGPGRPKKDATPVMPDYRKAKMAAMAHAGSAQAIVGQDPYYLEAYYAGQRAADAGKAQHEHPPEYAGEELLLGYWVLGHNL